MTEIANIGPSEMARHVSSQARVVASLGTWLVATSVAIGCGGVKLDVGYDEARDIGDPSAPVDREAALRRCAASAQPEEEPVRETERARLERMRQTIRGRWLVCPPGRSSIPDAIEIVDREAYSLVDDGSGRLVRGVRLRFETSYIILDGPVVGFECAQYSCQLYFTVGFERAPSRARLISVGKTAPGEVLLVRI
jgi:hypothetical protein